MIKGIEKVYKDIQEELNNPSFNLSTDVKKLFNDFLKIDKNNDDEIVSQIEKICSLLTSLKIDKNNDDEIVSQLTSFFYREYWNSILERIKGDKNPYLYAAVYFDGNEENHTIGLFTQKEDAVNCIKKECSFEFTENEDSFLYDDCVSFFNMYNETKILVARVYKVRLNINESSYYSILGARD